MSTQIYYKCSKALRNLRFDWTQDPEVVLRERLKTVGLESEYLKTDPELFVGYCRKLYRGLEVEYHQPCCICSLQMANKYYVTHDKVWTNR